MDRAGDRELKRDLGAPLFALLAWGLPLVLLAFHRELGQQGDIEFFHEWSRAFGESAAFYRDGPGLNYPIAGVLLVAGPAWLLERLSRGELDLASYRLVLKSTIALGEVAFVFAAAALARALSVSRPRAFALLLYLLPTTWAGGAYFGQIDPFGSALLCASAAALIAYRERGHRGALALGLAALIGAILTKQLTWFAAPGLALLAALGLARHRDRIAIAMALASPLLLFVADPFLTLPAGFRSHLAFVLLRGSAHGELAVASGASLWAFFARGGTLAAEVRLLGVASDVWGWALFGLAMAIALRQLRRARFSSRGSIALSGFACLAMATLLTGVHERYLAHAAPLLLLADASPQRRALGVLTATVAGVFVLTTLHFDAFTGPLEALARPWPTATLALAWLGAWLALPWDRVMLAPRA